MKYTCLIPVYGSNRMLGEHVGKALAGCEWVGIGCAGGLSELPYITARTVLANDLNRHAINLAMVVADEILCPMLIKRLDSVKFHPMLLLASQRACVAQEAKPRTDELPKDYDWAFHYFVCSWMARNGKAGTKDEFGAGLSFRWESGGGDSAVRFRNATQSLHDWQKLTARCTFQCLDVFEFIAKVHDKPKHGLYLDPDWPGDGAAYKHRIGESGRDDGHARLAEAVSRFRETRVVLRYGDCPQVRELYPESEPMTKAERVAVRSLFPGGLPANSLNAQIHPGWKWLELTGRTAANKDKAEVLIVNAC